MENVIEIVLFEVKNDALENFEKINIDTINQLSGFTGYISSNTYQSINKTKLFLDIVEWESLNNAKEAALKVAKNEKFKPLLNSISKIHFFDHLNAIENCTLSFQEKKEKDILELALFYLKDNAFQDYYSNRIPLMNHLTENYKGFKQVSTFKGISDNNLLLDIAFWENAEICHKAQSEIESHQLFIDVFKNMDLEKEPIMEFFKKIR